MIFFIEINLDKFVGAVDSPRHYGEEKREKEAKLQLIINRGYTLHKKNV